MNNLSSEDFATWLREYGQAWEDGDAVRAAALFSEDARYEETPFDPPLLGREAIARYWYQGASLAQRDIRFAFQIICVSESTGIAAWQASFVRVPSGVHVELEGVLSADFVQADLCTRFREWWHRRERSS